MNVNKLHSQFMLRFFLIVNFLNKVKTLFLIESPQLWFTSIDTFLYIVPTELEGHIYTRSQLKRDDTYSHVLYIVYEGLSKYLTIHIVTHEWSHRTLPGRGLGTGWIRLLKFISSYTAITLDTVYMTQYYLPVWLVAQIINNGFFLFHCNENVQINPLTAKLFNLNFHPLEVVSRWRDPQLQVIENYSDLTKWMSTFFKYCWLMSHFIFNMFKRWYLMC